MGMSASQARLLSLTARMHDLEYQAQAIDYAKLALSDDSNMAYEEYTNAINSSKMQMTVVSGAATSKVDVTYAAMVGSANQPTHPMYVLTDAVTDKIYLPESVVNALGGRIPEFLEDTVVNGENVTGFLSTIAQQYVYNGQGLTNAQAVARLKEDALADYWTGVYYQLAGYTDNNGNSSKQRGMVSVASSVINDRDWIKEKIEKGEAILNVMQAAKTEVGTNKVNIFAETNIATDTNLSMAADELKISKAERDYENKLENINQKDKQFDMRLNRIENERNALKTEYDTVKQLVDKNIERTFKSFNA